MDELSNIIPSSPRPKKNKAEALFFITKENVFYFRIKIYKHLGLILNK